MGAGDGIFGGRGLAFPEEGVGDVNGGEQGEALAGAVGGGVVPGDGFEDVEGQAPDAEEAGANFGVGGAVGFAFGVAAGDFLLFAVGEDLGEGAGEVGGEQEFADVVEEAGGEGHFADFGFAALGAGDAAGEFADVHAVAPELFGGEAGAFGVVELGEDLGQHDEGLGAFGTEEHDGVVGVGDLAVEGEEGGVDDLKHLRGHHGVLGDEFGDVFDGAIGGLEFSGDPGVEGGHRGEFGELGDEALDGLVAHPSVELEAALEGGFEGFGINVEAEVLGGGADAVFEVIAILGGETDVAEYLRALADNFVEEGDAVHAGHVEVGNDGIIGLEPGEIEGFGSAGGVGDFPLVVEFCEAVAVAGEDFGIVVHEEDAAGLGGCRGWRCGGGAVRDGGEGGFGGANGGRDRGAGGSGMDLWGGWGCWFRGRHDGGGAVGGSGEFAAKCVEEAHGWRR